VNNEFEGTWKEVVVVVLTRHLPGGPEIEHEEPQLVYPISGPRFEPGTPEYEGEVLVTATTFSHKIVGLEVRFWKSGSV
jgi:hypothetical protein